MPLHLLGKKSWNVYNPANIERVKRDEEEARRKAIDEEKLGLRNEASDRLDLLKQQSSRDRKSLKRKLPGEDDTDREIRLAGERELAPVLAKRGKQDETSVIDVHGHIALVPTPQEQPRRMPKPDKDEHTVYLTDVVGERGRKIKDAWYASLAPQQEQWGDDSPRRKQREAARMTSNDPLAAMKMGVKTLRNNEMARKEWLAQRERDINEVEQLARKERHERKLRHRRRREEDDVDSLEGFDLDASHKERHTRRAEDQRNYDEKREHRHHDSRRHRHRHHHNHHPERAEHTR